jgi:predicted  nucleic acid-binding Zn-ribbon protein
MADSVTHEEFFKKQNKQQEMSPTDTETTMEDMQETIIQVQDSLKLLTNKTIQDRVHQYKEQQAVKTSMEGMKQKIEDLESEISQLRNSNEEPSENSISKLQTHKEDPEDSDSSVWEISSTSSNSEN